MIYVLVIYNKHHDSITRHTQVTHTPPFRPIRKHPGAPGVIFVSQLDIKLHSFSVYAGGKELVADATLNITMGGKYGLIGRNGIGKTSFLRALCR